MEKQQFTRQLQLSQTEQHPTVGKAVHGYNGQNLQMWLKLANSNVAELVSLHMSEIK